ncbi:MAG: SH3 domain-containing protein [Flavobacteriaceae bacterium]|nr:SH3 domain-containing protein [Flavobacteriaceae bacterium]
MIYFFKKDSNDKKNYFTLSSAFFCLTIIFILIGVTKFENQKSNIQAIIFEKKIDFRTEPNYRSEIQFNLHEGTKVNIIDELDDWVLVELSNGASGWIELKSIKKIN